MPYCLIKNPSRLFSSQLSAHNGSKVLCMRCFAHYPNNEKGKEKLAIHEESCWNNEAQINEMPKEGSFLIFKNHNRSIKVPFAYYADLESFTKEIATCKRNGEKSCKINIKDMIRIHCAFKRFVLMIGSNVIIKSC